MAVTFEIIEKSGAWFSYAGQRIGQGKDNARKFLDDNPEISAEVERLVREKAASLRDGEIEEGDEDPLDIRLLDMDEDGDGLDLPEDGE